MDEIKENYTERPTPDPKIIQRAERGERPISRYTPPPAPAKGRPHRLL